MNFKGFKQSDARCTECARGKLHQYYRLQEVAYHRELNCFRHLGCLLVASPLEETREREIGQISFALC